MKVCATKEQMRRTGVYCILNTVNGKRYVGSASTSFRKRLCEHCRALLREEHHSRSLQSAWNKYGQDAFEFRVAEVTIPEYAVAVEQVFIDYWRTTNRKHGYNMSPTAGSTLGVKHSVESRSNMSAAHKNRSAETRRNMSIAQMGKVPSEATRAKMGAANRGKVFSADHRAKIRAALKGRVVSQETREKLVAAHKRLRNKRVKLGQLTLFVEST